MKTVTGFPRAHGIGRDSDPLEELRLELTVESPHFDEIKEERSMVQASRTYHAIEAARFVDALCEHAPGAFVTAILGELHWRYSNVFRVADPLPVSPAPRLRAHVHVLGCMPGCPQYGEHQVARVVEPGTTCACGALAEFVTFDADVDACAATNVISQCRACRDRTPPDTSV